MFRLDPLPKTIHREESRKRGRRAAGRGQGPPRRRESRIEKCVSLNVIYSQQFYAFKARLSTATSASAAASASPCGNADDAILKLTVARLGEGCASETAALAAPLRPQ